MAANASAPATVEIRMFKRMFVSSESDLEAAGENLLGCTIRDGLGRARAALERRLFVGARRADVAAQPPVQRHTDALGALDRARRVRQARALEGGAVDVEPVVAGGDLDGP